MSDPTESTTPESPEAADPDPDARGPRSGLLKGRAVIAAAAIAIGVVAGVVIVSVTNGSDDEAAGPSDALDIAAGSDTTEDPGTTAGDDKPAPPADGWQVVTTGSFEIGIQPAESGLATITVSDPATPMLVGGNARHCVLVTLTGPATVESFGCATLEGTEPVELTLSTPGDPIIGCAAAVTREAPGEPTPVDATTSFVVADGSNLPAGDYDVTVTAVTGTGDGCAPVDGIAEHEAIAKTSITIT